MSGDPAASRRRLNHPPTRARQLRFLEELRKGWSVTKAAEATGIDRRRYAALKKTDESFAAEWEDAIERGTDRLADEAVRRAVEGYRDFRLDKDGNEHDLTLYSDKLLELELKRRNHAYRERTQLEITGAGGKPLEVGVRVEHDYGAILQGLEDVGLISLGPAARAGDAAPLALLPSRADGEAVDRPGGAPVPPD